MCHRGDLEPVAADVVLSAPQVAQRLGLTVQGAFLLVQRGKLPAVVEPDGRPRVTSAQLDAYVTGQHERAAAFLRPHR